MRAILSSWWDTEGLPPIDRLDGEQLAEVLSHIDQLDYDCRPF